LLAKGRGPALAQRTTGGTMKQSRRQFLQFAAVALVAHSDIAGAQSYPTRPVRVIVPYAPGGQTDVFARLIAQRLSEQFGKQFYVENIMGASGSIGTGQAARAAPDGHTILVAFTTFAINPAFFDKVPYDPSKDFDAVTLAVASTTVLLVNASVPAKSVKELVDLIRANPGKYSFASSGAGTPPHLLGEQFRLSLGLDLVHVPFNGLGPQTASVLAGHTPISIGGLASTEQHIKDGKLRVLAVLSKTRSRMLPDVPTMAESGYRDIEADSWVGVLVPKRTSKEIITTLHREIVRIIAAPDMQERLAGLGYGAVGTTPEEFAAQIKAETAKWAKVIEVGNLKPQ
jgi:tripartite-type tricarboxylate transporter receptor subunit TctC